MLASIKGIGEKTLIKLNKLGIFTLNDLISFMPKKYIDLSYASRIGEAREGSFVFVKASILKAERPFAKGKLKVISFLCATENVQFKVVWFNQSYFANSIIPGESYYFYGKVRINGLLEIINPIFEETNKPLIKLKGIKVIYPLKGYIAQITFSKYVREALKHMNIISVAKDTKEDLLCLSDAYEIVHFPNDLTKVSQAKNRIMLERTLGYMLAYEKIKGNKIINEVFNYDKSFLKSLISSLPYELTSSQIQTVISILEKSKRSVSNSIVAGDVGSGKTVVALLIAACVSQSGQVALMAPTEVLANQHYAFFKDALSAFSINVVLLTGDMDSKIKSEINKNIKMGTVDIVIGTQSVISNKTVFKNLRFIIIDEQHKFGVFQRTKLIDKGNNASILTLSATPIPRTMQLVFYQDIDFYSIENRFNKDNITTSIVMQNRRDDMFEYIKAQSLKGEKTFIVAPRITDDEGYEINTVESLYNNLKSSIFKNIDVSVLHSKMVKEKREKSLNDFKTGKTKIMLATSIIEVGVDIEGVNSMVVMNAEMFGLSTLHQLRGRVGRDGSRAYCFLYTEKTGKSYERLLILKNESNGFRLAEKDYELRGAGNTLGEEQTGKNDALGNIPLSIIKKAQSLVKKIDINTISDLIEPYTKLIDFERISKT